MKYLRCVTSDELGLVETYVASTLLAVPDTQSSGEDATESHRRTAP
jgi:hypothetical protein